jgi:WD40 repeat protein/tRNA A-37 threonylcarbamoyl transferase component Bud32
MAEHDDRLDAVIAECLEQVESGQTPDREALLAQHPDIADRLRLFFADCDRLDRKAADLRLSADPNRTTDEAVPGTDVTGLADLCRVRYFGDYELVELIARGGMGVVYKARQVSLNRVVALKMILKGELATPRDVERFRAEAEAAANLDHPHIVPIYEVGEHDGQQYYAMRYVEGASLGRHPRADARTEARVTATIARAVHHAHQHGILHRDIKPSNILVDFAGTPFITDFGLAKRFDSEHSFTDSGALIGTPRYMAPEQAANRKSLTVAADVYSLGVVLYERLTGRPPFKAETVLEILRQVREMEPARPSSIIPGINRDLETICLKCLEKDPAKRYCSADGLADDLERWLRGEPIWARRVGQVERLWRWCRRNPAVAGMAASIALLLTIALTGMAVGLMVVANSKEEETKARKIAEQKEEQAREDRRIAQQREKEASHDRDEASRRGEEARSNLYVAHMNLVQREYEVNNMEHARELLAYWQPKNGTEKDLRGFEWHYWNLRAHRELLTLKGHNGCVSGVCFSPDGTRLASADYDGAVKVWDNRSGELLLTINGHSRPIWAVCWSPDGTRLATASGDQTMKVWDSTNGRNLLTIKGSYSNQFEAVCFSPDGTRLATDNDGVTIWDSTSGQELLTVREHITVKGLTFGGVKGVCFSSDGKWLAVAGKNVVLLDSTSGKVLLTLKGPSECVCFSPDVMRLASAGLDGNVKVWDRSSGKELLTLEGHTGSLSSVAFSPDGTRLAVAGLGQIVKVWDSTSGEELFTLKGHTGWVRSVCFSPDCMRLASGSMDHTVKVWDSTNAPEQLTLKGHTNMVVAACFSPNGTRLASASVDQSIKVWDSMNGEQLLTLKGHTASLSSLCYSADGTRLGSASPDRTVRVWDSTSGKELLTINAGNADLVRSVCFSPNGKQLASAGGEGVVKIWDSTTGQQLLALKGHTGYVQSVCFSPDGKRIASGGVDNTVRLWDSTRGQELLILKGHTFWVSAVGFSPDGTRLASASHDKTIKLWDSMSGRELFTLKGHTFDISGLCFNPDGTRLASASGGTAKVWDATSGHELLTLTQHAGHCVCFSPDGTRLASASFGQKTAHVSESRLLSPETVRKRTLVEKVDSLFTKLLVKELVLRELRIDPWLSKADRGFALQVAGNLGDKSAAQLNDAAWKVVRAPGATKEAYAVALRQAEAAMKAAPGTPYSMRILGVAYYRSGDYAKALDTLERQSEKIKAANARPSPTDLAFLAMAQHQTGKKDEAEATLGQLHELMKQPPWTKHADYQGFLRETEELIEGNAAEKK